MMDFGTGFIETEAFLHACEDSDADSGNIDATTEYLVAHFDSGELYRLALGAATLSRACVRARRLLAADA